MASPYVLDSTAIIDLHGHFKTKQVRKALNRLARQDQLRMPEGVKREIVRRSDHAGVTVQQMEHEFPKCVVRIGSDPHLQGELVRIDTAYGESIQVGRLTYPGLWRSPRGRKAADAQVVAVAKRLRATAVSDDKGVQRVCLLENVPCIGWSEFARLHILTGEQGVFDWDE